MIPWRLGAEKAEETSETVKRELVAVNEQGRERTFAGSSHS